MSVTPRSYIIVVLLFACLLSALPTFAGTIAKTGNDDKAGATFTTVIDDLPLMPGLSPVEEKDVLFVTSEGRIAQTVAKGPVDIDEVYHFYQRSLPQLGWKKTSARTFERDGEKLRIDASSVNPKAVTIVRFSVQPDGE